MDADRRRQQEAVAENVEAETRDRVAQAQRTTAEAEVREKAAKTRVLAAQQKEQEDHAERQKMQEARVAKASPEVRSFLAHNPQLLSDKANASPGDICGGTCTPADLFTGIHLALAYQAEAALSACNEGQSFARELAEAHRRSALLEKTLVYIYGVSPADMARQHDAAWQKLTNPEVASAIKGVVLNAPQGCYNILRDTSLALTLDFQQ